MCSCSVSLLCGPPVYVALTVTVVKYVYHCAPYGFTYPALAWVERFLELRSLFIESNTSSTVYFSRSVLDQRSCQRSKVVSEDRHGAAAGWLFRYKYS